jgi:hypothetical protein
MHVRYDLLKKKLVISVFLWSLLEAVVRMLAGTCLEHPGVIVG